MTETQQPKRQASWKTLLIIGIVGAAVWLYSWGYSDSTMPLDIALRYASGAAAGIGLFAGLIMFITSRKD